MGFSAVCFEGGVVLGGEGAVGAVHVDAGRTDLTRRVMSAASVGCCVHIEMVEFYLLETQIQHKMRILRKVMSTLRQIIFQMTSSGIPNLGKFKMYYN